MGRKVNPDLVNKVKETSRQIYNKIPEKPNSIFTRKRIFIASCVILGLIVIGAFLEEEDKKTDATSAIESKVQPVAHKESDGAKVHADNNTPRATSRSVVSDVKKVSVDDYIPRITYGKLLTAILNNYNFGAEKTGKEMIVIGQVNKIEKDYITLKLPSYVDGRANLWDVKFIFNDPKELSNVKPTNKVSIKGIFHGTGFQNVQFDDCSLVENKKMTYNCQLSDQEFRILYNSLSNRDLSASINRECFLKRICERFGPKKSREWVRLQILNQRDPYYSLTLEDKHLLNRIIEFAPPVDQRMEEILQECEF